MPRQIYSSKQMVLQQAPMQYQVDAPLGIRPVTSLNARVVVIGQFYEQVTPAPSPATANYVVLFETPCAEIKTHATTGAFMIDVPPFIDLAAPAHILQVIIGNTYDTADAIATLPATVTPTTV